MHAHTLSDCAYSVILASEISARFVVLFQSVARVIADRLHTHYECMPTQLFLSFIQSTKRLGEKFKGT
jgi:hypothetical protein